jgi:Cytochrome C and Quinol oxidase polypeptide I
MNEAGIRDPNNAIARGRQHNPAVDRDTGNPPKHRPGVLLPRWGGRMFALGAFLLLAAGLSLGAWRHYSQHQEVMATAAQDRDFVPRVRVATVEPTGADVNAFFGIRSSIIAAPTGVKVFNWLFTMFRGRIVFKTPMLSAIGFIVHVRHRRPDRRIPAGAAGRFRAPQQVAFGDRGQRFTGRTALQRFLALVRHDPPDQRAWRALALNLSR